MSKNSPNEIRGIHKKKINDAIEGALSKNFIMCLTCLNEKFIFIYFYCFFFKVL